ncbi:hypothetical protein [Azospirillum halopraeferens]|uniref:hypothetical protein n=1 Tax=Azospirillum halopraeferens TaxID=34010 RepID=UPI0012EB730C|nr:hypothetical protein [Azospirillum halopraeferens]
MVKNYDELYHEVVRRAEWERSLVSSIDPNVIAQRIAKPDGQDAESKERVRNIRRVVEEAFDAAPTRHFSR